MQRSNSKMDTNLTVNRVVMEYANLPPSSRETYRKEFRAGGDTLLFNAGTLYSRAGQPILHVIDPMQTPPLCVRVAGTADGTYSFTNEIPVATLDFSDPKAHEKNLALLRKQIDAILHGMNAKYDMRIAFTAVLGVRHYINDYCTHFGLPAMSLSEGESVRLGTSILLQDDNQDVANDIIKRYKDMYKLSGTDGLDLIGA